MQTCNLTLERSVLELDLDGLLGPSGPEEGADGVLDVGPEETSLALGVSNGHASVL